MPIKEDLSGIVGQGNVSDSPEKLGSFARDNSINKATLPSYVIQPASATEIQAVVKLANEKHIPLIPVSSGIHFNGNTLPVQAGIIVDLHKMDKILAIDERNRMVRIQPGVTWVKLQSELQKSELMAVNPLFPHPLKSALTSFLEREPGLIPKFEYTDMIVNLEVILPDGELFRSGSACVPGFPDKSLAQGVNPSGPGDFMWNRLFQGAQGTLGIVTAGQVKIEYCPRINKAFFAGFDTVSAAATFIYRIQRRVIGHECILFNNLTLATILSSGWGADFNATRKKLAPWTVITVLGGGKRFPEDKISYEEEALREVTADLSITRLSTDIADLPEVSKQLPDMLRTSWPADKTYWKFAPKGACQDLYFHTTLNRAQALCDEAHKVASRLNAPTGEIGFYIQPAVYGGACQIECNLFYDAKDPAATESARTLYTELARSLIENGAFISRPYGPVADMVYNRTSTYTTTLKKLKRVLDPNNVMSPGRLCF